MKRVSVGAGWSGWHGVLALISLAPVLCSPAVAQGLAGEPQAIARAQGMVERVGGKELWARLASLHLIQRYHVLEWRDSVVHEEWIDFETPRLYVSIRNELGVRLRAYDARGGWSLRDGVFSRFTEEHLALERGFWERDMFRMFHRIASEDPTIELGMEGNDRLRVSTRGGEPICWFRLSQRDEPVLWGAAVGDYAIEFIFGPLERYGNILVPSWGGYTDGSWRFDMLDAIASDEPPRVSYDPPEGAAPSPR